MKKRRILIILILFVFLSGIVWAQTGRKGQKGLLFELPLESSQKRIGMIFYLSDTLILKPFFNLNVDFDADWDELAGTPTYEVITIYLGPGVAIDKIFVTNGPIYFYAGAAATFIFSELRIESESINNIDYSTIAVSFEPRIGAQYMFTPSFGIFGNLQFEFLYSQYTNLINNNAGTILQDERGTSFTVSSMESALGVVFFFK